MDFNKYYKVITTLAIVEFVEQTEKEEKKMHNRIRKRFPNLDSSTISVTHIEGNPSSYYLMVKTGFLEDILKMKDYFPKSIKKITHLIKEIPNSNFEAVQVTFDWCCSNDSYNEILHVNCYRIRIIIIII